jgi:hypothetical protein
MALDFDTAAAIAKDLLPYQEARKAPETPTAPGLPPELRRAIPANEAIACRTLPCVFTPRGLLPLIVNPDL